MLIMELIQVEHDDNVAILRLIKGTTHAIDLQMVDQLTKELIKVRNNSDIDGIVISSSNNKFFSIGLEIPTLYYLSKEKFTKFYQSFNQLCMDLFTFPKPTIAAIIGHAIAGGCIIALCCDYRYIAEGRKLMGLNEIKLGVPVPYPADRILRQIVKPQVAREIINSGEFYESDQLLQFGMVDKVLPIDQVLQKSIEKVKLVDSFYSDAFRMIKYNNIKSVENQVKIHLAEKEKYFINCWYSDKVRENLKNAMKQF